MLVSFRWLKDYVDLDISHEELADRLGMAGLNHEGTETVGDDFAIDLEVTSNRPDCLGHIGVAREAAMLLHKTLQLPELPTATESKPTGNEAVSVAIDTDDCTRYVARLIRGVKVGPSPDWLVEKLTAIGLPSVNNVVDATNFVMQEIGQPLHAFDFAKVAGGKIIVRQATKGEKLEAIDHKTYELDPEICVIADANTPVAIAGVMGGAASEVTTDTVDVLIESADFMPLSVRSTARKLKLFSDSSFRFERGVDPVGIDWASRRCCQIIQEIAGGEITEATVDVGQSATTRQPVTLRLSQLERILGIVVPPEEVQRILEALGGADLVANSDGFQITPPTWRRDLTREVDLIEEVARIYGYDKIPEDTAVPMVSSTRTDSDRRLGVVRQACSSFGFFEIMTRSVTPGEWSGLLPAWSSAEPLAVSTSMVKGEATLRQSLAPSLLSVMQRNESLGNEGVKLFETAKVYLPQKKSLPADPTMLTLAMQGDFFELKGVIEGVLAALHSTVSLSVVDSKLEFFSAQQCELRLDDQRLGILGEVSEATRKQFKIRQPVVIAEVDLAVLGSCAELIPQHQPRSAFPATSQDLNFILPESVRWEDLRSAVESVAGNELESVDYQETYRNEKADGPGAKRVLLTFTLRADDRTLTGEEADQARQAIITKVTSELNAKLVA